MQLHHCNSFNGKKAIIWYDHNANKLNPTC